MSNSSWEYFSASNYTSKESWGVAAKKPSVPVRDWFEWAPRSSRAGGSFHRTTSCSSLLFLVRQVPSSLGVDIYHVCIVIYDSIWFNIITIIYANIFNVLWYYMSWSILSYRIKPYYLWCYCTLHHTRSYLFDFISIISHLRSICHLCKLKDR